MLLTSQQNFHLKAAFFQGKTGKKMSESKENVQKVRFFGKKLKNKK